jgi:copper chaperone NosL
MTRTALALLVAALLGACREDDAQIVPAAVPMTDDALGYYCQMALAEHPGPKGQIHLKGVSAPLFFSQVRDAIAYQRMPEQSHEIAAVYVSDMALAPSWDDPGANNWILAATAHFVVGSNAVGGMGAAEIVPFSDPAAAQAFAAARGGRVVGLDAITDADVLSPDTAAETPTTAEGDYIQRLHHLTHEGNG